MSGFEHNFMANFYLFIVEDLHDYELSIEKAEQFLTPFLPILV